jgi:predicted RND superfamily exporter protein
MSFREKSAIAMALVMAIAGGAYAAIVLRAPDSPSVLRPLVPYLLLVIGLSVAVQIVLALVWTKEAQAPADEREKQAIAAAGNWGGMLLAAGVVAAGSVYLVHPVGTALFHHLVLALTTAQFTAYLLQVWLLRRAF